jgi:hypothetical protein
VEKGNAPQAEGKVISPQGNLSSDLMPALTIPDLSSDAVVIEPAFCFDSIQQPDSDNVELPDTSHLICGDQFIDEHLSATLRQSEAITISTNLSFINDVQGKKPGSTLPVVVEQNTLAQAHESILELIIPEGIEISATQPNLAAPLEMSHDNLPLNSALPQENLVVEGAGEAGEVVDNNNFKKAVTTPLEAPILDKSTTVLYEAQAATATTVEAGKKKSASATADTGKKKTQP